MPYGHELQHLLGGRVRTYAGDRGERLDVAQLLRTAPREAVVYVCGPQRLIDAVHAAGRTLGWSADRVRSEAFVRRSEAEDRPLVVELRRSGRRIEVAGSQSILDAVEQAGIDAPSSCRTGTCGTCATKVLAGTPLHRDQVLTAAERERAGLMCICVSRAQGDTLALDL